jgi:hypothetical protein
VCSERRDERESRHVVAHETIPPVRTQFRPTV